MINHNGEAMLSIGFYHQRADLHCMLGIGPPGVPHDNPAIELHSTAWFDKESIIQDMVVESDIPLMRNYIHVPNHSQMHFTPPVLLGSWIRTQV